MAEKIDELEVLITANTAQLQQGLKEIEAKLSGVSSSASSMGSKISAGAVALGGIIANVFSKAISQITANLDEAITRLDTLNNFTKVMGNLGIESSIAEQAINKLSDSLVGLPTSLSDAVSAVQRFTSANNSLEYSTDAYLAVNNAILAGGAGAQAQASALEQLAQAYSRNKMEMQDWKPILQAMPAQLKQVATYMGLASSSELYDALQSGKVSMNDFMDAIIALNENGIDGFASFEEQARTATGGVETSITNLKIAIQRAMANIMNVIGQTNISGFFNKIASAIGTASNYISAFVKLIKQAFAWISALFGKGGSTTDVIKETGSEMEGVASSTEDVADGLDDANSSAKKLKNTLAGFDEMNVLTESESSGSSSDSSSSSAGIDMSDYSWDDSDFTEATDKIEEALDRLKEKLDWINLDKLGEAIKQFKSDLDVFLVPAKQILTDVWEALKPFVEWAVNDFLPAFLNALGGAINFVGSVISSLWNNILKPFIQEFLQPIAEWTGGIIVDVLNLIGNTLRKLAGTDTIITAITTAITDLTIAFTASKIVNGLSTFKTLFDFFKSTGMGVAEALLNVSVNTTGLVSKLSGGGSSLLTSLDGVKSAFSALGSVISSHPIITLIAVLGSLLLQNENFRESLSKLISTALEPAMKIFDTVKGVIQPIIDVVIELVNTALKPVMAIIEVVADILSILLDCITPILDVIGELAILLDPVQWILQLLSPLLEFISTLLEPIADFLDLICGALEDMSDELVKGVKSLTNMGASEEEVLEIEEQMAENAEEYNDILEERNGILDSVADSLKSLDEAEKAHEEALLALEQAEINSGSATRLSSDEIKNLTQELYTASDTESRLTIIADTYGLSMDTQRDKVEELYNAILEENSTLSDLEQKQEKQVEENDKLSSSNEDLQAKINDTIESMKESGYNTDQLNETIKKLSEDGSEHSLALRDAIIQNADEFSSVWNEDSQQMEKASDHTWENISATFSGIGTWFGERWNDIKNALSGVGQWFKDTFSGAWNGITSFFSGIGTWFGERWNDIKNAFSGAYEWFTNIGSNIWNGIKNGIGDLGNKLKNMFTNAINKVKEALGIASPSKVFKKLGGFVSEGFAIGIDDESDKVQSSLANLTDFSVPEIGINSQLGVGISESLESAENKPISLLLRIDGEDIPISAERITNALNDQTMLANHNLLTI